MEKLESQMFTFNLIKNEFIGKIGTKKRTNYEAKLIVFARERWQKRKDVVAIP